MPLPYPPRTVVFVADDEPALLTVLRDALVRAGYEVETFPDGAALLARVDRRRPDLVLLDIAMPGLSGWEVQRELRDAPSSNDVPVVAITAQGGPSVEASALQALGFAGFLRKPFRLGALLACVEAVLARWPPRAAAATAAGSAAGPAALPAHGAGAAR